VGRPLSLALAGLALAVYAVASLTGGWLGPPPWWEREVSVEEYVEHRWGVTLASPIHSDQLVIIERGDREAISFALAALGLALFAWAAWPRGGKGERLSAARAATTEPPRV
jgi:hypothetical protein